MLSDDCLEVADFFFIIFGVRFNFNGKFAEQRNA